MENRRPESYEDHFLAVSTKMERLLFRIAILGFAGIIICQLVLSVPGLREVFSATDRLEGDKVSHNQGQLVSQTSADKELIINPADAPSQNIKAWVKINGVPVIQIAGNAVTVTFRENDVLEIDTSRQEGVYRFSLDHNDPSITSPTPGTLVEASQQHSAVIKPILYHGR